MDCSNVLYGVIGFLEKGLIVIGAHYAGHYFGFTAWTAPP